MTRQQIAMLSENLRALDAIIQSIWQSEGPSEQYWNLREANTRLADIVGEIRRSIA